MPMSWFETEQDRANEQAVVDVLCRLWKAEAVKLPPEQFVDYGLYREGTLKGYLEVKVRNVKRLTYPDYTVSWVKVQRGRALAGELPFILAVRWTDAIGWTLPASDDVRLSGRNDRGELDAFEAMVHIPHDRFRIFTL